MDVDKSLFRLLIVFVHIQIRQGLFLLAIATVFGICLIESKHTALLISYEIRPRLGSESLRSFKRTVIKT